ncbi:MAG: LacI family DNA-binding transcriptional regulator [Limnochordales bacterium]|nr:LacI family DNA-binding transcriptional regulator [Limnochordales bacterium]
MATIRDVARKAGVSPKTVSRVINGSPEIAPETRESPPGDGRVALCTECFCPAAGDRAV